MPQPSSPAVQTPGTPVPPAHPVCAMKGIAAFRPGAWDGKPVTREDLDSLVRNWSELAKPQGPDNVPYYTPFVSLKHKDFFNVGMVSRAYMEGETLKLDGVQMPVEVGAYRNAGRLHSPSIEFWEPGQFVMPDGTKNTTPVLKCVTLLGGDAPAVKNLGPLPLATFNHHGSTRRFAAGSTMGRQEMIAALQAAGFDVSSITDAVPDEVIKAMLAWAQANSKPPDGGNGQPVTMSAGVPAASVPATVPAGGIGGAAGGGMTVPPGATALTVKFADGRTGVVFMPNQPAFAAPVAAVPPELAAFMQQTNATLAGLATKINGNDAARALEAKRTKIRAFCDRMTSPEVARMTPDQAKKFAKLWEKCDDGAARKFSDSDKTGTELDEAFQDFESSHPDKVRSFGEKVGSATGGTGGAVGAGSTAGHMTPELRRQMLGATVKGQSILADEARAARVKAS